MKKIDKKRWEIAQDSEKGYWMQWETEGLLEYLEQIYKDKLKELLSEWERIMKFNKDTKILQIGCGPLDIINYFDKGELHSVDPLADFYKDRFKGVDYRKSGLEQAPGEELPYPDDYFDLVILDNVIDHTNDPVRVLEEIKRVLKDKGVMHLEVQVYQNRFLIASKIWAPFKKIITGQMFNVHHPHMFKARDIDKLVFERFKILKKEFEDLKKLKEQRRKQKFTQSMPAKIGFLGNINYKFICRNEL